MTKEELIMKAADSGFKIDDESASKIIKDNNLEEVAGGYPGHDKYSAAEYAEAGVTWHHYIFKKDEYMIYGYYISQDNAEAITRNYLECGVRVSEEVVRLCYAMYQ